MDVEEAIRGRRSIRRYRPDPVSEELIREVLDQARWSPSWRNTQVWHVWALTGAPLERFKQQLTARLLDGSPGNPDIESPGRDFPQACLTRTQRLMDERTACELAAGVDCSPEATSRHMGALFGAPCLLAFGIDDCIPEAYACFDTGAFVQSVCLAAHARGLGTCIMATSVRFPEILHELLPDAADKHLVVGVAIGYPDADAAINTFVRERAELEEFVRFVE